MFPSTRPLTNLPINRHTSDDDDHALLGGAGDPFPLLDSLLEEGRGEIDLKCVSTSAQERVWCGVVWTHACTRACTYVGGHRAQHPPPPSSPSDPPIHIHIHTKNPRAQLVLESLKAAAGRPTGGSQKGPPPHCRPPLLVMEECNASFKVATCSVHKASGAMERGVWGGGGGVGRVAWMDGWMNK